MHRWCCLRLSRPFSERGRERESVRLYYTSQSINRDLQLLSAKQPSAVAAGAPCVPSLPAPTREVASPAWQTEAKCLVPSRVGCRRRLFRRLSPCSVETHSPAAERRTKVALLTPPCCSCGRRFVPGCWLWLLLDVCVWVWWDPDSAHVIKSRFSKKSTKKINHENQHLPFDASI